MKKKRLLYRSNILMKKWKKNRKVFWQTIFLFIVLISSKMKQKIPNKQSMMKKIILLVVQVLLAKQRCLLQLIEIKLKDQRKKE